MRFSIGEALEEVKKGSRYHWTWLPWKLGALFGITGGVGGGLGANVPGAVVGGVGGAAVGGYVGHKIKSGVNKNIDEFHAEKPSTMSESTYSRPKISKKSSKK